MKMDKDQKRKAALEKITNGMKSGQSIENVLKSEETEAKPNQKLKPLCITLGAEEMQIVRKINNLLWEKEGITTPKLSQIVRAVLRRAVLDDSLVEAYKETKARSF